MKKKTMFSRLILAFASIVLVVMLSSCGESEYPITPSKWVVTKIEPHKNGMNLYLVSPIETKDLNVRST